MVEWQSRWHVVVASDVSGRDGIGWEFTSQAGQGEPAWAVFREDGGPFPVFSSTRGPDLLPSQSDLDAMTTAAVGDLFSAAGLAGGTGWLERNVTSGLLWASRDVTSWEGEEWDLESGPDDQPKAWAQPDDARTPYAWLRTMSNHGAALIGIYQDDAAFGLTFTPFVNHQLPESDAGSRRSRRDIPLVTGPIRQVEIVCDTLAEGVTAPGLITEALLHGDTGSTLLIAAEAYSRDEWHLYDESIVTLASLEDADALDWVPARQRWRSTHPR
jgi:hypothetical protein